MARVSRLGFLAVAVVFHLIYIWSIFDIYFVSPIVHGMTAFEAERPEGKEAPARRLVLFVGDGLRADKAFQSFPDPSPADATDPDALTPRPLAPFLRSRVLSEGTFGVSHTRVPTESRPGHVALIAGLYEDVSAVMTGWKLNPVNFDSVFNRSRHTWSWGSPDILPMFKEGAVPGRIDADVYAEEAEDYTQDATHLDTWVFEKVKDFFASAATNSTLDVTLRQDKLVFFLHLLGLDTTGHAYRPYSKEYLHNIKVVDRGVQEVTKLIDNFYGDQRTAYVFTADHGMSDWGSHGDGHPDNTRTPLIAWGSGVAKPMVSSNQDEPAAGHEDGFSTDWNLDHIQRNDVSQADIAALMAYLVGLEFPVNSVGELPLNYLAASPTEKAEAVLVNAREILEMYRVKEEQKAATKLAYQAYAGLVDVDGATGEVRQLIDQGQPEQAIAKGLELIQQGLHGLRYLQRYDWAFLRTLVALGYLGWIAFALVTVIDLHVLGGSTEMVRKRSITASFGAALVALYALLWIQHSSWTYYAYALFPVVFWEEVVARRKVLAASRAVLLGHVQDAGGYVRFGARAILFIALLESFAQGYFYREIYSLCYVLAGIWPASYGLDFVKRNAALVTTWALACIFMSSFTLLPVVKVEDINLILIGGSLMVIAGVAYLFFGDRISGSLAPEEGSTQSKPHNQLSRIVIGVQTGLIVLAMLVTRSSVASLQAKQGLPLGTQVVGWLVMVASVTVPLLHSLQPINDYFHRLVIIFLTFSPIFVILTISYEGLFYVAFCITLVTWVRLEHQIYQYSASESSSSTNTESTAHLSSRSANPQPANSESPTQEPSPSIDSAIQEPTSSVLQTLEPALAGTTTRRLQTLERGKGDYRALTLSDARIALFFLFLIQSAFFSTGNIASVASFSLDSVYRLIPIFNPFSQAALLLLKLMVPFALVSANLGVLNGRLGVAPSALFMIVSGIGDAVTLTFFFMVRDEGSWLEIGTSISHFFIASLLCVFVAALEALSELFVRGLHVGGKGAVDPAAEAGDRGTTAGTTKGAGSGAATEKKGRGSGISTEQKGMGSGMATEKRGVGGGNGSDTAGGAIMVNGNGKAEEEEKPPS